MGIENTNMAQVDENKDQDVETLIILKSGGQNPKSFEISKKDAKLSKFVATVLEGDAGAKLIEIQAVPPETLEHVIDYLKHHKGKEPDPFPWDPLSCPIPSIDMAQIVSDKWDATFIDAFDKKTIFDIIEAANYLDIKSLFHLSCAKVETLIKKLSKEDINRIFRIRLIEAEEKWRCENAQNDEAK